MIQSLHNCFVSTQSPALVGMLVMIGHQIHYAHDVAHFLQSLGTTQPDGIIIDCSSEPLGPTEFSRIIAIDCYIVIRGDLSYILTEDQKKHIQIVPASTSDEDIVKALNNLCGTPASGSPSNASILIVEDNNDIREMYVLSFHSRGYTVYEADDGLDGMTKAAMHQPTIIILDIMMPHMDGFEVLHALKNNTSIRPIVIVNSNLEGVDEEKKVKDLGADYFLRKSQYTPLNVVDFIEKNILKK